MKKVIALLIAAALILSLTGCAGTPSSFGSSSAPVSGSGGPGESSGSAAGSEKYKVAIVTSTESFEFFITSQQGMKDTLDANGVEWTLYNWDLDMDRQLEYLTQCMAMEYDAVICSFYDNSVANNVLQELNDAGIAVVTWEQAPSVPELAQCTVLSDDFQAGYQCGLKICEDIGGKGQIFSYCNRNVNSAKLRYEGLLAALEEYPDVELVTNLEDPAAENDTTSAQALIQSVLQVNPDVKGFFSSGESISLVAAPLFQDLGKDIVFATVDCTEMILNYVEQGVITYCVDQQAYQIGVTTAESALKLLNGEAVEQTVNVPVQLVDLSNYKEFVK